MADVPISGLTDATTIVAADELPIVQSGVTKRIRFDEFSAAITIADATETDKGVARLASAADALAGVVTDEIITPATMKSGIEGGVLEKILVNGATGSTNDGDINITGEFKVNGSAIGLPTATPVSFSAVSSVVITVDLSTYVGYTLDYRINSFNAGAVAIDASSNAGVGYGAYLGLAGFITTPDTEGVDSTNILSDAGAGASEAVQCVRITQPTTGGNVNYTFVGGHVQNRPLFGGSRTVLTAACNRIKLTFGGSYTGYYILTPIAKR